MPQYLYEFGDGETSELKDPGTHLYKIPGRYTIRLTVDSGGAKSVSTKDVLVKERPEYKYDLSIGDRPDRKSFHLGVVSEIQGNGWSENSGDWIFPEDPGAVVNLFDDHQQGVQLVFDSKSGLPYIIDVRDGEGALDETWMDKYDPLTGSGTEIETAVQFPREAGEMSNYQIEHMETNLFFGQMDDASVGATGYTDQGMRDAFAVNVVAKVDGLPAEAARMTDVPTDREVHFDRRVHGQEIALRVETEASEYKLSRRESYFNVYDRARYPSKSATHEADYQLALMSPAFWLTRGPELLLERVTNNAIHGSIVQADGPDGKTSSAFTVLLPADLRWVGDGGDVTVMFWSTGTDLSDSLVCQQVGESITAGAFDWKLWVYKGSLATINDLPPGGYFDFRIYSGTISDAAIDYYYNNIKTNHGDELLPPW